MLAAAAQLVVRPLPAPALAFLDGIGAMEMMLIAVIGLLLFGGKGLPDMARTVGKVVREFKKATRGVEDEVRRVMHDEPAPAPRPRPKPRPVAPLASPTPPTSTPPPGDAPGTSAPAPSSPDTTRPDA